jgi:cytochrome c-550 PedF
MKASKIRALSLSFGVLIVAYATPIWAHGDVTPQPVNTEGLKPLGDELLEENPYRGNELALEIGASAYNQNCARCHGLQVISGGFSPDLRYLPPGKEGDQWFMQRVRKGATVNGVTKMPAFEELMNQEAIWAIRTFVESKYEDD